MDFGVWFTDMVTLGAYKSAALARPVGEKLTARETSKRWCARLAEILADVVVQSRRLVVMAEKTPRPRALLASPNACGLVTSVLAVVEWEAARDGRGRDAVLLAVERWYDFHSVGCHLGNVGTISGESSEHEPDARQSDEGDGGPVELW